MKDKAGTSNKAEGSLKPGGGAGKRRRDRKKAAAAASGKPKRPPSAFFVFMSEFRQEYQAKHPTNKSVAAVSKAAGEKWRSMSDEDKAPYVEKAGQKKQDYEKTKATFEKESTSSKKAKTEEAEGEGSDKSKSEVDDEDAGSDEDNEDE